MIPSQDAACSEDFATIRKAAYSAGIEGTKDWDYALAALGRIEAEVERLQRQLEMADTAYRSLAEPGIR